MDGVDVITSTSNQKVKYVASLLRKSSKRKEDNVYVVEGLRIVLDANIDDIRQVYISDELIYSDDRVEEFINECRLRDIEIVVVSAKVMKSMSDTVTPQGILAVINRKNYELLCDRKRFLLLEDIQDPGNINAKIRQTG